MTARTRASVLCANYPVENNAEGASHGKLSTGWDLYSHVRTYTLEGHKVYDDRLQVHIAPDGSHVRLESIDLALGDWQARKGDITLTREQFDYLKEVWK